ncbi:MAG: TIM barrel protein [Deltaproteobacteria bacterium]|nr:TIM barrel protein [Deltaproteobacteria bacterium]
MAVGISSYAYRCAVELAGLDAFGLLERSQEAGAEVVQICDNLPLDGLPGKMLDALAGKAGELRLVLEVGMKGCEPESLHRNLEVTRRLGASLLRVVLPEARGKPSRDGLVAMLGSLLPELREWKITLAVENHFGMLPSELAGIVTAVGDPLVGVCLDPVNSVSRLVGPGETVATLAPLAVSVHAKDVKAVRRNTGFYITGCPLGEGMVDLPELVAALHRAGRSPNFLVEAWMDRLENDASTLSQEDVWTRHGIRYMKDLLASRGSD